MDRPLAININARVCVTLTKAGRRWFEDHYADLGVKPWNADANPKEFTLWELMHIFGPHLYMGATEVPFVDNVIILMAEQPDAHLIREVETPVAEMPR